MRSYLQVLLNTPSNSSSNSSSNSPSIVTPASEPVVASPKQVVTPIESVDLRDDTGEDSSDEETSAVILTKTGSKKRRKIVKKMSKKV
jgi:hypothetical protein